MARTVWKGSLSFGLVNVPVGLYPATHDRTVRFNQFEAGTSDRIRYKRVNERTGDEVAAGDIVRGVDLGEEEYVLLSDDELEAAEPERSRLVVITDFVDLDEIDPKFFRSTYYLAPEGEGGAKSYALLREAMHAASKVAIGTLIMRNKEYPVAVRSDERYLILQTMYFADEIRSPEDELPETPGTSEPTRRELAMAEQLIGSMGSQWDPSQYRDTHREKVEALVEQKRAGNEIVVESRPEGESKIVDLAEVLRRSIESVEGGKAGDQPLHGDRRSGTGSNVDEGRRGGSSKAKKPASGRAKAAPSSRSRGSKRSDSPKATTPKAS